jgi:hypothetical protein
MTVLTANKTRPAKAPPGGFKFRVLPLVGYTSYGAAHTVYKGSIVACDLTAVDGYYHAPVAVGTTPGAIDDVIGGIAMEKAIVETTDLANGAIDVTVAVDGVWAFENADSLTVADVGKAAYGQDDDHVNVTRGSYGWWIGIVVDVDDDYIWVNIKPACGHINTCPT